MVVLEQLLHVCQTIIMGNGGGGGGGGGGGMHHQLKNNFHVLAD